MVANIWAWVSATLGLLVLVATYLEGVAVGSWFSDHSVPDEVSSGPQIALALLGAVLILGGLAAGLVEVAKRGRRSGDL